MPREVNAGLIFRFIPGVKSKAPEEQSFAGERKDRYDNVNAKNVMINIAKMETLIKFGYKELIAGVPAPTEFCTRFCCINLVDSG